MVMLGVSDSKAMKCGGVVEWFRQVFGCAACGSA